MSLAIHSGLFFLLFGTATDWTRTEPPKTIDPAPVTVALVNLPRLAVAAAPAAPRITPQPQQPHVKPHPQRLVVRPRPAPPHVRTLPEDEDSTADSGVELSEAQLAGAVSADSGPAGGACNMARWLQSALRKDAMVQAAVAEAHRASGPAGKALMVWNGDWVKSHGEEGKGLATVREAITWEIAFAPKACRSQSVRGLVLISLNEAPGSMRLAVGSGEWRWSDLLSTRASGFDDAWSNR